MTFSFKSLISVATSTSSRGSERVGGDVRPGSTNPALTRMNPKDFSLIYHFKRKGGRKKERKKERKEDKKRKERIILREKREKRRERGESDR